MNSRYLIVDSFLFFVLMKGFYFSFWTKLVLVFFACIFNCWICSYFVVWY